MPGGADAIARLLDRLAGRVDRLENRGESESEISTTETIEETMACEVIVELQTWTQGEARFNPGFGRDAFGFGQVDPGKHLIVERS